MKRKSKKTKQQNQYKQKYERYKGLKKGSLNYKVFSILVYLLAKELKVVAEDIKSFLDLFGEYTTFSIVQKFHKTYYSTLENSSPTGQEMRQTAIRNAIKKLESMDYIKIANSHRNKGKLKISLTKKGALEYLRYKIDQKKKKGWDGKWRIVVFDIQEDKRQIRDLLRARLQWFGFKELQKSVWLFPYDIEEEVKEILDICNIDIIGDIRFLIVEKISDDNDLRQIFDIGF